MTEELTVWADESEWVDRVHLGNCLQILRRLPDNSIDSIVCDPPYGLGTKEPTVEEIIAYLQGASLDTGGDFMGYDWKVPSIDIWKECFRVLKPGGHLLSFAGTRTFDLISIGLRAAGFENRDCISEFYPVRSWVHSQGFPKSLNISKSIDKIAAKPALREDRKRLATHIRECRKKNKINVPTMAGWFPYAEVTKNWERLDAGNRVPSLEDYNVLRERLGCSDEFVDYVRQEAERQVVGHSENGLAPNWVESGKAGFKSEFDITVSNTEAAKEWDGWGTQLKPAWEPILCFRKPIVEATIAEQILSTGTGAMNIDATRVAADMSEFFSATGKPRSGMGHAHGYGMGEGFGGENANPPHPAGRFPANMILVHGEGCRRVGTSKIKGHKGYPNGPGGKSFHYSSDERGENVRPNAWKGHADEDGMESIDTWDCEPGCPVPMVDAQSGDRPSTLTGRADPNARHDNPGDNGGASWFGGGNSAVYADSGGASRFYAQFDPDVPFFYCAKASRKETTLGGKIENLHPTKKPLKLMQYLVKLVTPKGAIVLDPYCGSGTTCVAAVIEGMHYVGIELDPEWIPVIEARIAYEQSKKTEALKAEEGKQRTAAEMLSLLEDEKGIW